MQVLNYSNSCVAFSGSLTEYDDQFLADCLNMPRVPFHHRYLGMLVFMGRSKKNTISYIKGRLSKKLNEWKGSLLSSARKEILIKTMAQVVPMYTMQTFSLLKTFCDELNQMVAQFWWDKEQGK